VIPGFVVFDVDDPDDVEPPRVPLEHADNVSASTEAAAAATSRYFFLAFMKCPALSLLG
jgi:hypothetical protein